MIEGIEKNDIIEKIKKYEAVEIMVNDQKEMFFEGIIDPVYIELHFERLVKLSNDFDRVTMVGYYGNKNKELIAEVFV